MAGAADRRAGPVAVGLPPPGRRREAPEPGAAVPRREAGRAALPPAPAPAVARCLAAPDRRVRRQLRHCAWHITAVYWYEVFEAIARRIPGARPRGEIGGRTPRARSLLPRFTRPFAAGGDRRPLPRRRIDQDAISTSVASAAREAGTSLARPASMQSRNRATLASSRGEEGDDPRPLRPRGQPLGFGRGPHAHRVVRVTLRRPPRFRVGPDLDDAGRSASNTP